MCVAPSITHHRFSLPLSCTILPRIHPKPPIYTYVCCTVDNTPPLLSPSLVHYPTQNSSQTIDIYIYVCRVGACACLHVRLCMRVAVVLVVAIFARAPEPPQQPHNHTHTHAHSPHFISASPGSISFKPHLQGLVVFDALTHHGPNTALVCGQRGCVALRCTIHPCTLSGSQQIKL